MSEGDLSRLQEARDEFFRTAPGGHRAWCPLTADAVSRKTLIVDANAFLARRKRKYNLPNLIDNAQALVLGLFGYAGSIAGLDKYLEDPLVTEITIWKDRVRVEHAGTRVWLADADVSDLRGRALSIATWIAETHGYPAQGMQDFFDIDGTRINLVFPDVSPSGAVLTIRRQLPRIGNKSLLDDLPTGLTQTVRAVIAKGVSIVVTGASGTGKSTLISELLATLAADENTDGILCEAALEITPPASVRHLVVPRPASEDAQHITLNDVVRTALRMRPDVIVVGEIRGRESEALLSARSTGLRTSIASVHASGAKQAANRMMACASMDGSAYQNLPPKVLLETFAQAYDLFITLDRDPRNGRRFIASIEICTGTDQGRLVFEPVATAKVAGEAITWDEHVRTDVVLARIAGKRG